MTATREATGLNVYDQAILRIMSIMKGNRVTVSFSAGKDSNVCLELALQAAKQLGYGRLDVVMQEEEIAFPGTYEYAMRVANRSDVEFHWIVMQQPMMNCFNRADPYFWVMDPKLPPEKWVRKPPPYAQYVEEKDITATVMPKRFPVECVPPTKGYTWGEAEQEWPGQQKLVNIIGLRVQESVNRLFGLFSSGGHMTQCNEYGVFNCRPIYDWTDGDVWKFIKESGCDYNKAYNTMFAMGLPRRRLRIAPPTMNAAGIDSLGMAMRAWPQWFERVADRLPGVRTAAQFGKRAVSPFRRHGETWEQCFKRECIAEAPKWIADRSEELMDHCLKTVARKSTAPFPEVQSFPGMGYLGSWRHLAFTMWSGDPFGTRTGSVIGYVEPSFFRPDAGSWHPELDEAARKKKTKVGTF